MSATSITARFDGKVLVPETPLDAEPGAKFDVVPQKPAMTQAQWLAFLDSVEGSWTGPETEEPYDPPLASAKPQTPEEWKEFVRRTSGAWKDFDFVEPEELPYDKEELAT